MKTFKEYMSEMKKPRYEVPAEPGSTPVPAGKVKLYHQTAPRNLNPIRKQGIRLDKAKGYEGPKAIYAAEPDEKGKGFYGHPNDTPTAEIHVDKKDWKSPFVHKDKVEPHEIVATHKDWHATVRYIDDNPNLRKEVEAGEHDHLMKEKGKFSKAVRFVKKRAKAKQ